MDAGPTDNPPSKPGLPLRKVRLKVNKFLMPASKADAVPHFFNAKQVKFLEVYAETLDFERACKDSEMAPAQVKRNPYILNEIKEINQAAMFKHRGQAAKGTHLRLMDKFEKEFDNTKDVKLKSSAMSTLARMSEANMRAAGEFGDQQENTGISGVQVVINIGEPPPEPTQVEGTVIDVS